MGGTNSGAGTSRRFTSRFFRGVAIAPHTQRAVEGVKRKSGIMAFPVMIIGVLAASLCSAIGYIRECLQRRTCG